MLEVEMLSVVYPGDLHALRDLSFTLAPGNVLGVVGLNGTGKTSLLNALSDQIRFQGRISIHGEEIGAYLGRNRNSVALIADTPFLYPYLTVLEYVTFIIGLKDQNAAAMREKVAEWLERFDLTAKTNILCKDLSLGQKKKLFLIAHLVYKPHYVIMDEPTNGMDVQSIIELENAIKELSSKGCHVVLSTHNLSFFQNVCSHSVLLSKDSPADWSLAINSEIFHEAISATRHSSVVRNSDARI